MQWGQFLPLHSSESNQHFTFKTMAWIQLTRTNVLSALNSAEEAAYNAAVTGDIDPAEEILLTAVREARGHIEDHPGNRLAAGDTIPERIEHHVLAIVRFRIMTRLDISVSEDRRQEYRDARRFLERVSEGKVSIEKPSGAVDNSAAAGGTMEVIESSPDTLDREGLSAL
jgi:phage gp36-like protein